MPRALLPAAGSSSRFARPRVASRRDLGDHRDMATRTVIVTSVLAFSAIVYAAPPGDGPALPEENARPGATRDQAIDAFAKDCHATLNATAWEYGEEKQVAECLALDVDQNCNPDILGC